MGKKAELETMGAPKEEKAQAAAPSFLSQVKKGKNRKPPRIVIYGVEGVGKSTLAAQAPDHIFLLTEDGVGEIDCNAGPLVDNYYDVLAAIQELKSTDHPYKTFVLDSLSGLRRLIDAAAADEWTGEKGQTVKNVDEIPWGKSGAVVLPYWQRIFNGLDLLREKKMTVVLLGHSSVSKTKSPGNEEFKSWAPRMQLEPLEAMREWCDGLFFANYVEELMHVEKPGGKFEVLPKGNVVQDRLLYCQKRSNFTAKSRYPSLKATMPMEWAPLIEEIRNAN